MTPTEDTLVVLEVVGAMFALKQTAFCKDCSACVRDRALHAVWLRPALCYSEKCIPMCRNTRCSPMTTR